MSIPTPERFIFCFLHEVGVRVFCSNIDTAENVTIEIEENFMTRQTRTQPVHALAEPISNSVDADASHIIPQFGFNDLAQRMSEIVGYGDRQDIPRHHARQLFDHLGGSRKPLDQHTNPADKMGNGCGGPERDALCPGGMDNRKVRHLAGERRQSDSSFLIVERKDTTVGGSYRWGQLYFAYRSSPRAGDPDAEIRL
jgi:hypothetical protein